MNEGWKDKLIVASIDFGTTYSGFAVSLLADYENGKREIILKRWQPEGGHETSKTPTCVLLKPGDSFDSFGYEAEQKYAELSEEEMKEGWRFFRRFKMELFNRHDRNKSGLTLTSQIKDVAGKEIQAITVFSYALKYMKEQIIEMIRDGFSNVREDDIHYVLTVPAIWSEQAKRFMRNAALNAQIPKERFCIALEPECAAVYVHTKAGTTHDGTNVMAPDSSYIIIDLGGGTLDIAAHRITQDEKFEEIISPDGGAYGGDNINLKFEQLLLTIAGSQAMNEFRENERYDFHDLQQKFEFKKRAFDGSKDVILTLPGSFLEIHQKNNKEDMSKSMKEMKYSDEVLLQGTNKLKLKKEHFQSFLTETVDGVVTTVQNFLEKIPYEIKTVIAVGGFSECKILKKALREKFPDKKIIIPDDGILAVMKGAIVYGRDHCIFDTRISRCTIGLDWNEDFDRSIHHPRKRENNEDGNLCKDIFLKLVAKGDKIKCGKPTKEIEAYVKSKYQTEIVLPFYRSEILPSPTYIDDIGCRFMGSIKVELDPKGPLTLDRHVNLKVYLGATEFKAEAIDEKGIVYEAVFHLVGID